MDDVDELLDVAIINVEHNLSDLGAEEPGQQFSIIETVVVELVGHDADGGPPDDLQVEVDCWR